MSDFTLNDVNAIESEHDSEEQYYAALQRAINDGTPWKFQGSYGRSMMEAINAGRCMLGHKPAYDYWGNRIPSRHEVQDGTKGSPLFVAMNSGYVWAEMMEAL